jgi:NAD+ synthase
MSALTPVLKEDSLQIILDFIDKNVKKALVNVSGGVDSAVVLRLCTLALGAEKVLALLLPDEITLKSDLQDSIMLANKYNVKYKIVNIGDIVDVFKKTVVKSTRKIIIGNLRARIRMVTSYYFANLYDAMVVGTSNKSELLTGYFTKYGDGGADILPIGDLYKTQVKELANKLKIPAKIIKKVPSAGLWVKQTDEGELGLKYEMLDRILLGFELNYTDTEINRITGIPYSKIRFVRKRVMKSVHKRKLPPIPKIGIRTIGIDWRE